jgi:polar amino acid transport system substrate-binding protein
MKKVIMLAAALIGIAVLTGCSKKESISAKKLTLTDGVLKIGTEIGYPPFEYYAEDGKTPGGFDIEMGTEIAKRLGCKVEFVDTAWDGILAGLDTEKYDCIMSAMTITPERQANYDFSCPYIGNGQSIVLLKTSKLQIKTPSDLAGLKVAYQAETTSDIFMKKQAANGLKYQPEEYDKVLNAFDDLRLGRADAVCADVLVSIDYINKPDSPFVIVWKGIPDEFFGVSLKKGNAALQTAITKSIKDMFADGTMEKISQKNFNADMVSTAKNK